MPNPIRHLLGAVLGLLLVPLVLGGMALVGMAQERVSANFFSTPYIFALLGTSLGTGAVLGACTGSRLSPLATLIPGVLLFGYAVLLGFPATVELLGPLSRRPFWTYGSFPYALISGLLLVSSVWPSRWRAAAPRAQARYATMPRQGYGDTEHVPPQPTGYGQNPPYQPK